MIKFENGKHLTNYILKILRNTNDNFLHQEEIEIRKLHYLYDFVEFYIDIVECPVTFDSSFSTWIEYAKRGNSKKLCEIVKHSIDKIEKFKRKEVAFDDLFDCLDLDMKYRNGYLESKPHNSDIYYPFKLSVITTRVRHSYGTLYCYNKPNKKLKNNYGCYLIYDYKNKDEIVYVGKSNSNLLNRAYDSARERTDGKFSKIELLEMPSHADTNIYEIYYISKYKPRYNVDSICEDFPSFNLDDIAVHHTIELVKEEPFEVKQLCFEEEFVSKEAFWNNNNYLLFTTKNLEKRRKELCNNIEGIVDGANIYSRKDLYEQDGYLCTLHITNKNLISIEEK